MVCKTQANAPGEPQVSTLFSEHADHSSGRLREVCLWSQSRGCDILPGLVSGPIHGQAMADLAVSHPLSGAYFFGRGACIDLLFIWSQPSCLGQRSSSSLVVHGGKSTRLVQCYSSMPDELMVRACRCDLLTTAGISEGLLHASSELSDRDWY